MSFAAISAARSVAGRVRFALLLALLSPGIALADLGASVTLASGQPTSIYPGEITQLQITLSNNNTTAPISSVAFSNSLPGTLPNGLKVAGAATYTCYDPAGPTTQPGGGTLTTAVGAQGISLAGGTIPARANNTDGTCTIILPVTAGTSTGSAATYTYTIASGAVTGNDGAAVANVGAVSQSINVQALSQPTISKSFSNSTAVLGGAARTLTITLNNTNPVAISGFSIADAFPQLSGQAVIRVANPPNATASCNNGGAAPVFSPSAGDTSVSATGTIPARTAGVNGSCTLTVSIEAATTNGNYTTGARTNTIDATSQFSNDLGIRAAANASANITVTSPLRVIKSVNASSLATGQSGYFTLTLYNDGSTPLNVTSLTDSPIDGVTGGSYGLTVSGSSTTCTGGSTASTAGNEGVTLSGGTIPANGSCTVTINFTGTVQNPNTPSSYTNTLAQGAVNVGNPAIVSQSASAAVTVYENLNVTKSVSPSSAAPGNPVRYQVTVQNWSAADINNVAISESLASGQTFLTGVINGIDFTPSLSGAGCSGLSASGALGDAASVFTIGTLPQRSGINSPGACTVTFWAMTATAAANGSAYTNNLPAGTVCYAGPTCNGGASNTTSGSVNTAVLSVAKTFSQGGTTNPPSALARPEGTIVRMTLTLSNLSASALTSLAISDTLPTSGSNQLRIASPANAASTCGSPTITAVPGSTSLSLNGGTVPARAGSGTGTAGSCVVQVDVIGAAGTYNNTATATATETYANGSVHTVNANSNTATVTYTSALSATKSFSPAAVSSGGRSTVTLRLNNSGAVALTNVAATDPLPTGMTVASPANAYTTCAGTTAITAVSGSGSASLSGADIAGGGNCDFIFDVVATGGGNWVNTIPAGNITADGGITNQTVVTGTLTNSPATGLTVAKATNPSTLTFPGQVSQLTLTIGSGAQAVSGLALTDYFTADGSAGAAANGMVIAATPAASTSCAAGSVSAAPGGTRIALSGATLSANASCTVTVNVTSTSIGGITNYIPAGAISTQQGLSNSGQASTSLTTQSNVGITKQFTPNVVKPGERSRLRITLYNPMPQPVSSLSVLDTLPSGMTVPSGANPTTTCSGATVGTPTTNQVQVSGGSLAGASGGVAATCYAEIDVLVAGQGDYVNTIPAGAISATSGGVPVTNSQPTSDTLHAKSPLVVNKAIAGKTLDAGNPGGFTTGTASRAPGAAATLTIRLANPNASALTGAVFTDVLPSGLVVATTPNAATTCAGGTVTAAASATQIRLSGATIPAAGACTVSVDVLSNISGSYTNTLAAGSVSTFEGVVNEEPTSATLLVSTPPTVSKQFSPAVIQPNGVSQLTIVLGNDNASAITLSSVFTDTLPTAPGAMIVATPNGLTTTCPGAVTATAGSGSVSYASGASIPAGGCRISVNVTAATPGDHTNNIPAGGLQTNFGNNQQPTNVVLKVSTQGYVSGRAFADNNVTPNGVYDVSTDAPLAGSAIELRSGASCAGALVASTTTDSLGNYLFAGLAAGTYSVCQFVQPAGTTNGITTAGSVSSVNGSTGSAGTASNPGATTSQVIGIVLNGDGAGGEISGSPNNNFAEIRPSSIAGTVFLDQNNNGVQNGADTPFTGETIDLLDSGNSVIASTTTDASGQYSFGGLQPGTYSIRQPNQPASSSNGITTAGAVGNGGTAGTPTGVTTVPSRINGIVLPPATASTGNNFAEIANGRTLSGRVFLDYNGDGALNGVDYGLGTQTLNLSGTDINGNAMNMTTLTASDGRYSFTGLPEGTYSVTQPAQPTGTTNGTTTAGSTGGTATGMGATPSAITAISLLGVDLVSADNNFAEVPGAVPDLAIAKTHAPSSFASGSSTGVFTLTPRNVGTVPTSGSITVVDTLPAGMSVATPASGTGWTCSGAAGASSVSCTTSDVIAAGSTGNPILLRVAVASGQTGQILVNTATISGGGEPPGFDGNNTASDSVPIADAAQVSGTVWTDTNHDRVLDPGEPRMAGWQVDLLLGGSLVATSTTDANGAYQFTGIAPSSGYIIQFHDPDSGRIWGNAVSNEQGVVPSSGTRDTGTAANTGTNSGNPAGAVFSSGSLAGLTLVAGDNIVQQSLPIDPSGVVYDAITRNPVPGAQVTLVNGGAAVPDACLVGGTNTQTTGANGLYQFLLLNPAPPGCPGSGTYTLQIVQPGSYLPPASTIIPPTAGPYVPSTGGVDAIQAQPGAPTGADPTVYYTSFALTLSGVPATSSSNVVNNHIPLDPVLGGAIVLTKTSPLVNVSVGQLVPYTISARNTLAANLTNIDIRDIVPPGFKYKSGSASVDGVMAEPVANGRNLAWSNLTLASGATRTVKLLLVVGAGVQPGEYVNTAQAFNNLVPAPNPNAVSNVATATVRVIPDPTFDCSDLVGKVFDDRNANGYQDEGEPGIPNVRLATARGWLVTTDAEGRFHVACAAIPDAEHGSNFIMKLDERTLPTGYRVTTENPRDVRLTRGKLSKLNFGATIHKVVRVDMSDAAFEAGTVVLRADWAKQLAGLEERLKARPTVLRLGYKAGADGEALARERLHAVSRQLKDAWQQHDCCHTLLIEEELFLPAKAANKEGK